MRKSFRRSRSPSDVEDGRPSQRGSAWFRDVQREQRASGRVFDAPAVGGRLPSTTLNGHVNGSAAPAPAPAPAPAAPAAPKPAAPKTLLSGIVLVAVTPFHGDDVALDLIRDAYAPEAKADGVTAVVCCPPEEGLSVPERKAVAEQWIRSGLPTVVCVSAEAQRDVADLAAHAMNYGAAAVIVGARNASAEVVAEYVAVAARAAPRCAVLVEASTQCATAVLRAVASRGVAVKGAAVTSASEVSAVLAHSPAAEAICLAAGDLAGAALAGATAYASPAFGFASPLAARVVAAALKGDAATVRRLTQLFVKVLSAAKMTGNATAAVRHLTSLRLQRDIGSPRLPVAALPVHQLSLLEDALKVFVAAYAQAVQATTAAAASSVINVKALPGFNGKLNAQFRQRVAFLEQAVGINITKALPHLYRDSRGEADMSWRRPVDPQGINPARFIDHTILKAEATAAEVSKLCTEAKTHDFYAVCVNGCRVEQCLRELDGSSVAVAAVIGFPLGAGTPAAKAKEAREIVRMGAREIDMVMNVGAMKDRDYRLVYEDIKAVCDATVAGGGILKVIFETCLLSSEEIIDACILSVAAGAHFVKTSTGFNKGGATPEAIDIMLALVGNEAEVKASGGVRDAAAAFAYIEAGVRRIGTSSGVAILQGKPTGTGY